VQTPWQEANIEVMNAVAIVRRMLLAVVRSEVE